MARHGTSFDAAGSTGESKGSAVQSRNYSGSAEIAMVPQNYVKLTGAQATQMVRLVEALEEHETCSTCTPTSTLMNRRFRRCRSELINVRGFFAAGLHLGHGRFS